MQASQKSAQYGVQATHSRDFWALHGCSIMGAIIIHATDEHEPLMHDTGTRPSTDKRFPKNFARLSLVSINLRTDPTMPGPHSQWEIQAAIMVFQQLRPATSGLVRRDTSYIPAQRYDTCSMSCLSSGAQGENTQTNYASRLRR